MRYIAITEPGGPEVLILAECERPVPAEDQVLIKTSAAGVNRPDILQRLGKYPPPPGASPIPGLEVSGEIVQNNSTDTSLNPGNRVCALVHSGGYADFVVADSALCLPIPAGLSMAEAAAIPETFYTVWSNVFDRGGLQPGERLLVHGGSSGIGTTAIQLGKAFGAIVFTTAGNEEKCKACVALGASLAINYREQDFVKACLQATANQGIDVILDMVAGEYLDRNIEVAAADGRIIIIAGLGGHKSTINIQKLLINRLTITGSTLRPRPLAFKAAIAANLKKHVWPKLEAGEIRPVIFKTLPLEQAADAHRLMESSQHIGKIVLTTGG